MRSQRSSPTLFRKAFTDAVLTKHGVNPNTKPGTADHVVCRILGKNVGWKQLTN